MKKFLYLTLLIFPLLLVAGKTHAQKRTQRTASARAAYGNAVDFNSNSKRNKKAKKKAKRSAEKKKLKNSKDAYRRGMPI